MRHRIYGYKLGRNKDQRDNLFKGLLNSLITYGTIQTSNAKAKAIKGLVDRVINLAKRKDGQSQLQSFVTDENLRERLIKEIVPKLTNRNSGYTSLMKIGTRLGDQTLMVKMSLIGSEELKPIEKVASDKRPTLQVKRSEQVTSKKEIKRTVSEKKVRTGQSVSRTTSRRRATSRLSKNKK